MTAPAPVNPDGPRKRRVFVVVLDISLRGGADGLELLKTIRVMYPWLPVLVMSMHDETTFGPRALQAGAKGYPMKGEATTALLQALRTVLRHEIYVSPRITRPGE